MVINSGSPGPGDFSTLRNLTLNGNVGQVAIPPGSYGNFVANGNSGFTLGIAGATEPSRYALQQLTLNGATQLNVVGPIILTLVHGFSANGDLGASSNPSWLKLNVQSGAIVLNGGASLCGYVVAPDSTVILNGNSRLIGGLVSNRLTLNGNSLLRIVEALANRPPSVVFTAPADGAVVSDTSAIVLTAAASDPDGTIAKVEFFSGPTKLGEATVAPYQCSWTNVTPGSYTLTARATDDLGEVAISDSVSIQVLAPNVPPSVSLTTPVADMVFSAPAGITLSAAATDADGSVAKVEFFNGEAKLGEATVAPYDYVWRDVASGVYVLTVRATDDAGAVGLSDPVSIRVNAHPAAVALTLTTMINTALPVILAGSDPEGDALAFSVMTPPAHGTLSGTAPALTYTPMADYAGADAFSYAVSDPYGSSEPAIVSIQVEAPVEPPTAENAALEVQVGSSAPITLQGADARGRPLTFTIVTPPALGSVQQISNEGQTSHWTYSAGSAAGLDTFTFIVSNGAQSSSPATVKIRVLPAPPLASGTQGKAGGIVRDALTLEPLEGVTVRVEGVDGAVLSDDAGNFMLPVVNFGDETAVSEVLVYEAPGYIPAYRRVIAYPDVPVTADPVFLKKYDSKITPIGPAGGTATSAAGDVEADFPAGASSGTMAVQLTNYSAGRELPGPLPRASAFTYAVDLAPNGAAFSSPVTVRIAKTLGFAPHTSVPVGVFNPETARWEPESMASISADGQWVVFQVTHFSARDANLPAKPMPVHLSPNPPKSDSDPSSVKTDPGVSVAQGTYETDIDLPGYRSIGRLHTVRLRYESPAASARRPFTIQALNGFNSVSPLARAFDVDIDRKIVV